MSSSSIGGRVGRPRRRASARALQGILLDSPVRDWECRELRNRRRSESRRRRNRAQLRELCRLLGVTVPALQHRSSFWTPLTSSFLTSWTDEELEWPEEPEQQREEEPMLQVVLPDAVVLLRLLPEDYVRPPQPELHPMLAYERLLPLASITRWPHACSASTANLITSNIIT